MTDLSLSLSPSLKQHSSGRPQSETLISSTSSEELYVPEKCPSLSGPSMKPTRILGLSQPLWSIVFGCYSPVPTFHWSNVPSVRCLTPLHIQACTRLHQKWNGLSGVSGRRATVQSKWKKKDATQTQEVSVTQLLIRLRTAPPGDCTTQQTLT